LHAGYPAKSLVLAGDSAGAGLALAAAIRLRDAGEPLPAALGLLAPWTDLTVTEESLRTNAAIAPLLRESWLRSCVAAYCGGEAVERVELSPQRAELSGLPPMVVHDGADDLVASDAQQLTERARAAGVEVVYRSFAGLWHDFELLAGLLADADDAIAEFGATLRSLLGR
ncbi:MAG: alpha/beta hydrolase fold domain-containing protein, partial [Sciscionella sp.]